MAGTSVSSELGEFIEVLPPMKRVSRRMVPGHGRRRLSEPAEHPDRSARAGSDPLGRPHLQDGLRRHGRRGTTRSAPTSPSPPFRSTRPRPAASASRRSIADYRVYGFEEKPQHGNPVRSVFNPDMVSASMGIYVFNTQVLIEELLADAADPDSSHDFGKDILPRCLGAPARGGLRFPRHQRQGGALLARRGHARRLLRSQYGSDRRVAGVQPVRYEMAHPHARRFRRRRRNSCSRRKGSAWESAIDSIVSPGLHRFRRTGESQRARAVCAGEQLLRSGRFDSDAARAGRAVQPGAARHYRRRRDAAGEQPGRLRSGGRPRAGPRGDRIRHHGGAFAGDQAARQSSESPISVQKQEKSLSTIVKVSGIEILDSRGNPTVEAEVFLADGSMGRAAVPSGASTGEHEAVELRDGDKGRYLGKGTLQGRREHQRPDRQSAARPRRHSAGEDRPDHDRCSTARRTRAISGANAMLAVSMAVARAAAASQRTPLYRYLGGVERLHAAGADDEHPQRRRACRQFRRHAGVHDRALRRRRSFPKRCAWASKSSTR